MSESIKPGPVVANNDEEEQLDLYYEQPGAGTYAIGESLFIYMRYKPSAWHRYWTRVLLGWVWADRHED
jgi:hypothetical protein